MDLTEATHRAVCLSDGMTEEEIQDDWNEFLSQYLRTPDQEAQIASYTAFEARYEASLRGRAV